MSANISKVAWELCQAVLWHYGKRVLMGIGLLAVVLGLWYWVS
jgi:hypothetical protein